MKAIIQCSTDMQDDLSGKRTVGNFVEWCDTPIARKPGPFHYGRVLGFRTT